ncbi:MAG: hypothetical protein SGI86_20215 [Deltaproteobacteria bacterium]|nr:hypothetical protein [Deltaproteobacteria bacterium]
MSLLNSVKDMVIGQAMKVASDPRVTRMVTNPKVMDAAMKAMSVGGTVKEKLDEAGRIAGSALGLASQQELSAMRNTIQNLEDQISILESRAAAAEAEVNALRSASSAEAEKAAPKKKAAPSKE